MSDWKLAWTLLDRFEQSGDWLPADVDAMISEIFRACGHSVADSGFVESDSGVDLFVETQLAGVPHRIAIEVKYRSGPAGENSIRQLLAFRENDHLHRTMVVSRSGFTPSALRLATENGVGVIDLLSPADLRNWLAKHVPDAKPDPSVELIVRAAMKDIARRIAEAPGALASVLWLDLERVLREVFEALGFDTQLTRPGKDGGFDLELITSIDGKKKVYLVEVKHWIDQKPGPTHLNKLVQVTTSRKASAGLLLSTSGFTNTLYEGLAAISAPVRIGDGSKVVSLCRAFYRLDSVLWVEDRNLETILFEGTQKPDRSGLIL